MYTFHKKDNLPIYRAPINKNKSVYRKKRVSARSRATPAQNYFSASIHPSVRYARNVTKNETSVHKSTHSKNPQ